MNGGTLLVDPLAALFRPALARCAPLILDSTHVEVTLLPPLAQVAVIRRFTNTSDRRIEAVLTLPPIARQEVVFRLIVNIGGVDYDATPQPAKRSRRAHDEAVADGRRAILYELLKHDIQMISIAGIEPEGRVEVQIWSIKPLGRPEENRAVLSIPLSARHDAIMSALLDADALVTTEALHNATLVVNSAAMRVTLCGQGAPYEIISREPVNIDCAAPIQLEIVAGDGGSLDHSAWQVDKVGGWEVTSARGIETFRHPMNPGGSLTSNRSDWIFGIMEIGQGEIRVTAPLPTEGIAPNARALRAFAAAALVESATPQGPDGVRHTANILSRQTSLAFIGPEGELSNEIPVLRKLALPEMLATEEPNAPPQPVALEPFPIETPPAPKPLLLHSDRDPITPGARPPRHRWRTWGPVALVLLWIAAAIGLIDVPLRPVVIAFFGVMILSAMRFLPREGSPARRRLPFLAVLGLPWIASFLGGPLSSNLTYGGGLATGDWMIPFQYGMLATSAALPFALMPIMRNARRFTLVFGILNLALTFFATSASVLLFRAGS